jgi:hypothetical protein
MGKRRSQEEQRGSSMQHVGYQKERERERAGKRGEGEREEMAAPAIFLGEPFTLSCR